jgi:hypothetical protein
MLYPSGISEFLRKGTDKQDPNKSYRNGWGVLSTDCGGQYEVIMVVHMYTAVLWDMMPRSLVDSTDVRGNYSLRLHGMTASHAG